MSFGEHLGHRLSFGEALIQYDEGKSSGRLYVKEVRGLACPSQFTWKCRVSPGNSRYSVICYLMSPDDLCASEYTAPLKPALCWEPIAALDIIAQGNFTFKLEFLTF